MVKQMRAPGKLDEQQLRKEIRTGHAVRLPESCSSLKRKKRSAEERDLGTLQQHMPIPVAACGEMDYNSRMEIEGEEDMVALMKEDIKQDIEIAIEEMVSQLPIQTGISLDNMQPPSTMSNPSLKNRLTASPIPTQIKGGEWTQEEHELFLKGFRRFGSSWTKVAAVVKTRTNKQIRSHAQNHFKKLKANDSGFNKNNRSE